MSERNRVDERLHGLHGAGGARPEEHVDLDIIEPAWIGTLPTKENIKAIKAHIKANNTRIHRSAPIHGVYVTQKYVAEDEGRDEVAEFIIRLTGVPDSESCARFKTRRKDSVQSETFGRFTRLTTQWKGDTMFVSSSEEILLHPAFQRIIGMGEAAIPHILRTLKTDPNPHWFWALSAITEHEPSIDGDIDAFAKYWLAWGRKNKHI